MERSTGTRALLRPGKPDSCEIGLPFDFAIPGAVRERTIHSIVCLDSPNVLQVATFSFDQVWLETRSSFAGTRFEPAKAHDTPSVPDGVFFLEDVIVMLSDEAPGTMLGDLETGGRTLCPNGKKKQASRMRWKR